MDRYEEALERAKAGKPMDEVFPELKESEDERIRKGLIYHLKELREWKAGSMSPIKVKEHYDAWIAYLEKQKELYNQADWNEYKDKPVEVWIAYIKGKAVGIKIGEQKKQNNGAEEYTDFTIYHPLKNGKGEYECIPYSFYGSLTSFSEDKDLIDFLRTCFYTEEECNEWIEQQKEQKPAEWSEEDSMRLEEAIQMVESNGTWVRSDDAVKLVSNWLKSLRPQPKAEWSEGTKRRLTKYLIISNIRGVRRMLILFGTSVPSLIGSPARSR